jgi:hypothetical protein
MANVNSTPSANIESPNQKGVVKKYQSKKLINKNPPEINSGPSVKLEKKDKIEISDQAKKLADQNKVATKIAGHVATNAATGVIAGSLKSLVTDTDNEEENPPESPTLEKSEKIQAEKIADVKVAVTEPIKTKSKGTLKKPGVFFITGLETFSLSNDYDGLKKMAEAIPEARVYGWNQKNEVIEEVLKRAANQKIILVGHSFGGDTAVDIANELNSLKHGFKKVDLLVTLDSVGRNNDIIPQNVKSNLNFFGEKNSWLNDQPNVARNNNLTQVINELRHESHTDLDDSNDIQYKIMTEINALLS